MSRLPALVTIVLTSSLAAAQTNLVVKPCGGSIGQPTTYELSGGKAKAGFIAFTSTKRAFLPLSLIDPKDTRSLRVSLDMPFLNVAGALDTQGKATWAFPIPNDPALAGLGLLSQGFSFPGQNTIFDGVSDVAAVLLDKGGAFRLQTKTMISARAFHGITRLVDGRYLVVGGGRGTLFGPLPWDTTEVFDAATRTWSAGPKLTTARAVHTQTRLADGRILVVGGVDALNIPLATAEIYDPVKKTWSAVKSMGTRRMGHTATLMSDGKVFVAGGLTNMNDATSAVTSGLRSTEIYDPKTNTWSIGPRMSVPRSTHSAIALGKDRVLLAGGIKWRSFFFFKIPSIARDCNIYNHTTRGMARVGSMLASRCLSIGALLPNGKALMAGGLTGDITAGGSTFANCEVFDPTTNTWAATASLAHKRAMPAGVTLGDGRFAVLGGGSGNLFTPGPIKTAEVYDPKTSTWSALPDLTIPRLTAAAVLLDACGVLVTGGGSGASANAVSSVELYLK